RGFARPPGVAVGPVAAAGRDPLPEPRVPPARTGRGPIRPDPARDARPRRVGRADAPGRAVPRQAAADVLARRAELPHLRRLAGVGPARARGVRPPDDPGGVPARPAERRRAGGALGGGAPERRPG